MKKVFQNQRALAALLVLSLFTGASCMFFTEEQVPTDEVPQIRMTELWRHPHSADTESALAVFQGVVYFTERMRGGAMAVRISDGQVLSDIPDDSFYSTMKPLIFSNGEIGYLERADSPGDPGLHILDSQGRYQRFIQFPSHSYLMPRYAAGAGGTSVYIPSFLGLVGFDILQDPQMEVEGQYSVTPRVVFPNPPDVDGDGDINWYPPLVREGILYGGYNNDWGDPGMFFALNTENDQVIWELPGENDMQCWSDWPMDYRGGALMAYDAFGIARIDAESGEYIWQVSGAGVPGGGDYAGAYYWNGLVYITNTAGSQIEQNPNNFWCFREDTGEPVWSLSYRGGRGANPVVKDGIMYKPDRGFRLWNALTGELLAEDPTHPAHRYFDFVNVLLVDDVIIYRDENDVIALRADWQLDNNGRLYQEP